GERLGYVPRGSTPYIVQLPPERLPEGAREAGEDSAGASHDPAEPWYTNLWGSITTEPAETPADPDRSGDHGEEQAPPPMVPAEDHDPDAEGEKMSAAVTEADLSVVEQQLGRTPRGVLAISCPTPVGEPRVARTAPRLPDATPFPSLSYLPEPALTSALGALESVGVMREMSARLATDTALAARYRAARDDYLAERDAIEDLGTEF